MASRIEPMRTPQAEPFVICAPMVLGSELAFRMLVRRHGVSLCYTPMLKADKLLEGEAEANQLLDEGSTDKDSPLALQICGRVPSQLASAVRYILTRTPAGKYPVVAVWPANGL